MGGLVALGRIAQLARISMARLGTEQRHLAAGLAQTIYRIPHFHLLILLFHQDSGALPLQFHRCLLEEKRMGISVHSKRFACTRPLSHACRRRSSSVADSPTGVSLYRC